MEGTSRSGLVVLVNGAPVIWKSAKQSIVTKSSTEAELVALTNACTDVLWLRNLLIAQGYDIGPVNVGEDNQSVLAMLEKRSVGLARTRHINVRYFFVVDGVGSGELKITYAQTKEMVVFLSLISFSYLYFKIAFSALQRRCGSTECVDGMVFPMRCAQGGGTLKPIRMVIT